VRYFSVISQGLGVDGDLGLGGGLYIFMRRTSMSPPRPGTNWANWSDAMGREMYLRRALDRLNFEYPSDDAL
jgi:hypothetical protein